MAIRIILIGLLILALAFALFTTLSGDDSPVQIGQLAHPFELQDEKGNRVELAQFRGKGVVLNFWAAWCLPCRNEMPLLEEEYQKRKDQGLEILAINFGETEAAVSLFRSNYDLTFPLLLDPDKIISTKYGVTALPVTYFIDPEGNVVSKVIGELEHDTLIENLDRIMP